MQHDIKGAYNINTMKIGNSPMHVDNTVSTSGGLGGGGTYRARHKTNVTSHSQTGIAVPRGQYTKDLQYMYLDQCHTHCRGMGSRTTKPHWQKFRDYIVDGIRHGFRELALNTRRALSFAAHVLTYTHKRQPTGREWLPGNRMQQEESNGTLDPAQFPFIQLNYI